MIAVRHSFAGIAGKSRDEELMDVQLFSEPNWAESLVLQWSIKKKVLPSEKWSKSLIIGSTGNLDIPFRLLALYTFRSHCLTCLLPLELWLQGIFYIRHKWEDYVRDIWHSMSWAILESSNIPLAIHKGVFESLALSMLRSIFEQGEDFLV